MVGEDPDVRRVRALLGDRREQLRGPVHPARRLAGAVGAAAVAGLVVLHERDQDPRHAADEVDRRLPDRRLAGEDPEQRLLGEERALVAAGAGAPREAQRLEDRGRQLGGAAGEHREGGEAVHVGHRRQEAERRDRGGRPVEHLGRGGGAEVVARAAAEDGEERAAALEEPGPAAGDAGLHGRGVVRPVQVQLRERRAIEPAERGDVRRGGAVEEPRLERGGRRGDAGERPRLAHPRRVAERGEEAHGAVRARGEHAARHPVDEEREEPALAAGGARPRHQRRQLVDESAGEAPRLRADGQRGTSIGERRRGAQRGGRAHRP